MTEKDRKSSDRFIKAYHEFREQVDLTKGGVLPEVDHLVYYMLMGVPHVPADDDQGDGSRMEAIDQRVSIFKFLFVEINRDQPETFVDEGLRRYEKGEGGSVGKVVFKTSLSCGM